MESANGNRELKQILDKFLDGSVTSDEMALLSEAAKQDPFLAEALEGLALLSPAERLAHIKVLKGMLAADKPAVRRVTLAWWKMAAAVLVLAILSVWGILELRPDHYSSETFSEKQTAEEKSTEVAGLPQSPDQPSAAVSVPENQNITKAGETEAIKPPALRAEDNVPEEELASSEVQLPAVSEESPKLNERPVETAQPDVGNQGRAAKLERKAPTPVIEPQMEAAASENRIDAVSDAAGNNLRNIIVEIERGRAFAQPVGNPEEMKSYLTRNLQTWIFMRALQPDGICEVEFNIDTTGTPVDPQVIRSAGDALDNEITRLLVAGPKWDVENAQVPKGRITVTFRAR